LWIEPLHKYLYAEDDPVNMLDPSGNDGLADISVAEGIGAGLDAMADVVVVSAERKVMGTIASSLAVSALIAIETIDMGEVSTSTSEGTNANRMIFRSMISDGGQPKVGNSARTLGIRPGLDIPIGPGNMVSPESGGMSVALDTPLNLPKHRLPAFFGGTGRDPVWETAPKLLGPQLTLRPDSPTHGLVEPSITMSLTAYEQALAGTRNVWIEIAPGN
jgi:hypothetical protein